jgi:hypothetical protein
MFNELKKIGSVIFKDDKSTVTYVGGFNVEKAYLVSKAKEKNVKILLLSKSSLGFEIFDCRSTMDVCLDPLSGYYKRGYNRVLSDKHFIVNETCFKKLQEHFTIHQSKDSK